MVPSPEDTVVTLLSGNTVEKVAVTLVGLFRRLSVALAASPAAVRFVVFETAKETTPSMYAEPASRRRPEAGPGGRSVAPRMVHRSRYWGYQVMAAFREVQSAVSCWAPNVAAV